MLNESRTRLNKLQVLGHPKYCAEQRYAEANAAVLYYANGTLFDASYALLEQSLDTPDADSQTWALLEQAAGTWGPCYTVEPLVAFNQLDPFINAWGNAVTATATATGNGNATVGTAAPAPNADADADADSLVETPSWPPFTPVHTLDPWLGDGLVEYCRTHLVSHITNDGINTREMLAAVSGDLSQMVSVRIWSV